MGPCAFEASVVSIAINIVILYLLLSVLFYAMYDMVSYFIVV